MFHFSSSAAACLLALASTILASPVTSPKHSITTNTNITRGCWKNGFDVLTDSDAKWPETGKTVSYHFDITNTTHAPDGVSRQMFLINGQYPGPTVEADWGDTICVTVKNSLEHNGTAIHWHGFRQLHSNTMDGTPGVTECPIAPGQTKKYCFKATQYGTSWYHSHLPSQYGDGILGPIIIHGPATINYDIDLGAPSLTDWYHQTFASVEAAAAHAAGPPTADNILINGTMTSSAGGKYAKLTLQPGKKHLLRFINTGINNYFHVSLDKHPFTVVSADFVPIQPYKTDSIVLAIGQRYDVVIDASQTAGTYWLRVGPGGDGTKTSCDGPLANRDARAIFAYAGAPDVTPTSTGITLPLGCKDETTIPFFSASVPSGTLNPELDLSFTPASGQAPVYWTINGNPIKVDWSNPSLSLIEAGTTSFPASGNIESVPAGSGWSYWVIQQDPNILAPSPHPIHLHGHDFFVLAQGTGSYKSATLNYKNPPRRDTATLPTGGHLILAFKTDNPGAWLMHCHIPFHAEGGLGVQFIERVGEISKNMDLSVLNGQCDSWKKWSAGSKQNDGSSGI